MIKTSENKIAKAQATTNQALSTFELMMKKLQESTNILSDVISKEKEEIRKRENNITIAEEQIKANTSIERQLKDFLAL